jgi:hypothetical protein
VGRPPANRTRTTESRKPGNARHVRPAEPKLVNPAPFSTEQPQIIIPAGQ